MVLLVVLVVIVLLLLVVVVVLDTNTGNSYYTAHSWHDWYALRPLSDTHMDAAVPQWKREFPMNAHTRERIKALEDEHTRRSKKKAGDLRNGAFAAYLAQTCIHKQLALACLKSPSTTVHSLLQSWTQYMHSPEHEKEKARSRRINPEDQEAVNHKKSAKRNCK